MECCASFHARLDDPSITVDGAYEEKFLTYYGHWMGRPPRSDGGGHHQPSWFVPEPPGVLATSVSERIE
jgi:hypothetical protein